MSGANHPTPETRYEATFSRPVPNGHREVEFCLGCGKEQPCPSDCPAGSGWRLEAQRLARENGELRHDIERHASDLSAEVEHSERLRAVLEEVRRRLSEGYERGCDCGGCKTMRYAEAALNGEPNSAPETRGNSMKVVVWKDGTYVVTDTPTWEYENDPDWLVTVDANQATESRWPPSSAQKATAQQCVPPCPAHLCAELSKVGMCSAQKASAPLGDNDGPGEEDGPWAEGWDKRAGRCTCEHHDRYHFDDGTGFVRCRATADCNCKWPSQNGSERS